MEKSARGDMALFERCYARLTLKSIAAGDTYFAIVEFKNIDADCDESLKSIDVGRLKKRSAWD